MNQQYKKPGSHPSQSNHSQSIQKKTVGKQLDTPQQIGEDIVAEMVGKINKLAGLKDYAIGQLVDDSEKLGAKLAAKDLKTTQIRKFLDAVNQFKARLAAKQVPLEELKPELQFLRVKLTYAAARQKKDRDPGPVEPLRAVLDAAIKKVRETEDFMKDFTRFAQLVESIVAYHKAAGGKDQ